jgi:type I restriction enzyme S subunit
MSWPRKTIGDVCEVVPGFAFKSKDLGDVGTPVIKIGNITENRSVDIESAQCLPEDLIENRHKKYFLRNGDILIAMTGATAGKVGRIRCAEDQALLLNQRVAKLCPISINPDFFWSAISTERYRTIFYGLGGGAAQPNMSGSQIEAVEIPYPPLAQQERIAFILSTYDDLIENNRRRIQLLEQAARLLYKEWFVHLRFPGHEHTQIIDGVPEGWEKKFLGDVCFEVRETVSPSALEANTPYIGLEHMPRRSITLCEWGHAEQVTSSKHRFREGEILFGKIRPYFHKVGISLTDGVASSDAIIIRPVHPHLLPLVLMTTSSDGFVAVTAQQMKEGSKMPRADWKQMQQYPVPLPPDGLLRAFNNFIDPILNQLKTLAFANKRLGAARDLLLPKLMNGEVAV